MVRPLLRLAAYLWAAPNTVLGLVAGLLVLGFGGRVDVVRGVAEFHGGLLGRTLAGLPGPCRFGAMTLGHVVLGVDARQLAALRAHEHAHVCQYERWGALFLPAYAASSVWQFARGRGAHRDNHFERQARAAEARATG